ncbi:cell wall-associated hydrolase, invasion-associated protein [Polaromonas sp. CF318]|uniref:C40 family peptidase n=1 Tax=Polaromonas sp. CF318 TaxID=1144318 RepID=UPI00027135CF|nr:C40 family peptidase [Polaromonas sp. CF318]EJL79768.1 cell wall-associated hydrolase, invasion-associated protein [Polaromonas sp. CF318]
MRKIAPALVIASAALLATGVHAAPGNSSDDMDKLLADKGLLTQIGQVRQSVSNKASELVVNAMGFLGVPYKRGGNTVETGFDCSGFVRAIYEQSVGLLLPRRAEQQAAATQRIEKNELQPGDLVFFNTMRRAFSHVGIYVGDGKFIHSPKPGAEVRVESMGVSYWQRRFDGARRVQPTGTPPPETDRTATLPGSQAAAARAPEIQAAQTAASPLTASLQTQQVQEQYRR